MGILSRRQEARAREEGGPPGIAPLGRETCGGPTHAHAVKNCGKNSPNHLHAGWMAARGCGKRSTPGMGWLKSRPDAQIENLVDEQGLGPSTKILRSAMGRQFVEALGQVASHSAIDSLAARPTLKKWDRECVGSPRPNRWPFPNPHAPFDPRAHARRQRSLHPGMAVVPTSAAGIHPCRPPDKTCSRNRLLSSYVPCREVSRPHWGKVNGPISASCQSSPGRLRPELPGQSSEINIHPWWCP
jgi:hypothetical protein